jgi:hypothetical protein
MHREKGGESKSLAKRIRVLQVGATGEDEVELVE